MTAKEGGSPPGLLARAVVTSLFVLGFLVAYLAVPGNPWLGGHQHGLLLRPEPVVLPVALLFGGPAIVGTSLGVLLHNLLYRTVPGGVSLVFSLAQTLAVLVGSWLALRVRRTAPRPYHNAAATWALSGSLVLPLGALAAWEDGANVLAMATHILREVLIPLNVLGLALLEVADGLRGWRPPEGAFLRGALVSLLVVALFLGATGHAAARCFGTPEGATTLWSVPIYAETEAGVEDDAIFGVAEGASNLLERGLDEIEAVATSETELRVYLFLPELLRFPPAKLNKSFIAPSDNMRWELRVEYRGDEPTTLMLEWDPREALQADPPVTLRLLTDDGVVDMLSNTSLEFEAEPGVHSWIVAAAPADRTLTALLVLGLVGGAYVAGLAAYLHLRRRRQDGG